MHLISVPSPFSQGPHANAFPPPSIFAPKHGCILQPPTQAKPAPHCPRQPTPRHPYVSVYQFFSFISERRHWARPFTTPLSATKAKRKSPARKFYPLTEWGRPSPSPLHRCPFAFPSEGFRSVHVVTSIASSQWCRGVFRAHHPRHGRSLACPFADTRGALRRDSMGLTR